jgi:miniconductance mechanosensitive channel
MSEVDSYNMNNDIDKSLAINGRNITNLGLFRKYVTQYLNNHPGINQKTYFVVNCNRHQRESFRSVCFYKWQRMAKLWIYHVWYFDHIIAAVPYFGLELYELRSNSEFIKQT